MHRLKSMKETLMNSAQTQMGRLDEVDAEELGEVIDMIKDLEEAIYYCTITKAMEEKEKEPKEQHHYYTERVLYPYETYGQGEYNYPGRDMDRDMGRMYYGGSTSGGSRGGNTSPGSGSSGARYYTEMLRDDREGRSPISRKMYMESKELHKDKSTQMKELEKYMQELSQDITEMIADATPEERQLLERRITQLATKVGHV